MQDSTLCLAALTSSDKVIGEGKGDDEEEEDDMFETEFRQYKRTYYMTKMGVDVVSEWVYIDIQIQYIEKMDLSQEAQFLSTKEDYIEVHWLWT